MFKNIYSVLYVLKESSENIFRNIEVKIYLLETF